MVFVVSISSAKVQNRVERLSNLLDQDDYDLCLQFLKLLARRMHADPTETLPVEVYDHIA